MNVLVHGGNWKEQWTRAKWWHCNHISCLGPMKNFCPQVGWLIGRKLVSWSYGLSSIVDYLMPNPAYPIYQPLRSWMSGSSNLNSFRDRRQGVYVYARTSGVSFQKSFLSTSFLFIYSIKLIVVCYIQLEEETDFSLWSSI